MAPALRTARRLAAYAAGFVICRIPLFRGYRKALLASWSVRGAERRDGLLLRAALTYWFRFVYLAERDPNKREVLKAGLMGGAAGVKWAEAYARMPIDFSTKVGTLTFPEACPLLPALDELLASVDGRRLVVQIGASSGREVAWLARRRPHHVYIGTDVYDEVVAFAAATQRLPNVSFEVCGATEIRRILDRHPAMDAIVCSSGSLQFVQPEHVAAMFRNLGDGARAVDVICMEPGVETDGDPLHLDGSAWAGNLGYTHNYRRYGEQAGFVTRRSEIIRPFLPYERFESHRCVVQLFWWGQRRNASA